MHQKRSLVLPRPNGGTESIETTQSVIFVGANGAGKTRLGTWIEFNSTQSPLVHRISAQKSLAMPDSTTPISIELAKRNLLFGGAEWGQQHKIHKWNQKPATTPLSDFEKLMAYLFSDETESNAKFKAESKTSATKIEAPTTKLDLIKSTWEAILPHRELIIGGLRIQTQVKGASQKTYNSSEMSDGERVVFYLIGQCLAAPENGIIVIDEPEIHLHKSIQAPLWTAVEGLRRDCIFVYLTHDVDFAAAREEAMKVWLKSFDGNAWDWQLIQDCSELPRELILELLGSRKPVVFVEGDEGSHDVALYRQVLQNFLVLPRGGCSQVILAVKALRRNEQLHHLQVYGLIDRDRRPQVEIDALMSENIFCLDVAEVENLFCTPDILAVVSNQLARNPAADLDAVSNHVFKQLQSELDNQISLRVASEIKHKLNNFNTNTKGQANLKSALQNLVLSINVESLYAEHQAELTSIISSNDYVSLLKVYNRKSLAAQVGSALGLKNGELAELVIRLAKSDRASVVHAAVKKHFGGFSEIANL